MKLMFDIGANRGDATIAGIKNGYKVIALEPAPRVFAELIGNFIYEPKVVPLRLAVGAKDGERLEFYECVEDGLSTLEKSWLTDPGMPYYGKEFRTISVNTCTVDWLIEKYGQPDLIKIDVEGAEWVVLGGMSKYSGKIALEWTQETMAQHRDQLLYLHSLGYKEYRLQFIEDHLLEPEQDWTSIDENLDLEDDRRSKEHWWTTEGWKRSGLRPTADVGMLWVR
jgi:FkbM family methyltransferase